VKNNFDVRNLLTQKNIYPEKLPPAEDIKKIDRKIKFEEKKLEKASKGV
jgi:DNA-damage-inducible protein D